jgi:hypothetical protein
VFCSFVGSLQINWEQEIAKSINRLTFLVFWHTFSAISKSIDRTLWFHHKYSSVNYHCDNKRTTGLFISSWSLALPEPAKVAWAILAGSLISEKMLLAPPLPAMRTSKSQSERTFKPTAVASREESTLLASGEIQFNLNFMGLGKRS